MPAASERLFVALTPPEAVRAALDAVECPLPGVKRTRRDQLHVTLRFLGEISAEKMDGVIDALASVRVEPFILPTEGLGFFPPDAPPKVLWAGVGRGHPRLFQLRQRIDDSLLASGLDLDVRTFHPHTTLGRCAGTPLPAAKRWLREQGEFVAAPFRIDGFDLYASELGASGMEYTLRRRFSLGT